MQFRRGRLLFLLALCASASGATFAWQNVSIHGMGYVTGMVIHPLPPHDIYIRTDVGGAYRYDRAARRWLPLMDSYGTSETAFGVESIAVDLRDPNTVYAAVRMTRTYTPSGGGYYNQSTSGEVLVSHSRGLHWTKTGMPAGQVYMGPNDAWRGTTGERLALDPWHPGVVYFGSRRDGLWRLNSSGWTRLGGIPDLGDPGITFVVAGPAAVYAGVYGAGVWASSDGGTTWASIGGGLTPVRAALSPDGVLAVTCGGDEGASSGAVARFHNGVWKDITPPGPVAAWSGVTFDPAGRWLAVAQNAGRNIFRSSDLGDSWQHVPMDNVSAQPPYYPPPMPGNYFAHPGDWGNAALVIDPARPTRLFQTNGYGVIATDDLTATAPAWSWRMQNLEELVVLGVRVPPLEGGADLFSVVADMIGFRHAGRDTVPSSTLGVVNFVALGTGLDYCASQPQYMAWVGWDEVSSALTGFSSDNGRSWTPFANISPAHGGRIAMSASDPNRLVWAPALSATPQYSADAGRTWHVCTMNGSPLPGSWQLGSEWWPGGVLAADRVDGSRFYLYNNGILYISGDGGVTWQPGASTWPTTLPVQFTVVVNIVPNPVKAGDLWLAMAANENQPGRFPLFHSSDGGLTFSAVASLDSANFVAFGKGLDAGRPAIYVHGRAAGSSDDAIYRSLDLGSSWEAISDPAWQQFGNISALEGDMRQADLIYVGTGGRGIIYGYGSAVSADAPPFTPRPRPAR
ncbi:MAG TPA: sialidase family protein [Bryobacteraceae bacterium]|nr:sialidase family protein [Bryobacteraceae bacterium]